MSERIYPVVLAAISESAVRLKWIKNKDEYTAFYARFDKPGTAFKEMKTIRTIFEEVRVKFLDYDYRENDSK
jgi:hypothetical protein